MMMIYHVLITYIYVYTYWDPFVNRKSYIVNYILYVKFLSTLNIIDQFSQPIKYSEFVLNDHDHEYIFISKYNSQKIRETK